MDEILAFAMTIAVSGSILVASRFSADRPTASTRMRTSRRQKSLARSRRRSTGGSGAYTGQILGEAIELGDTEAAHAHGAVPNVAPGAAPDPDYLVSLQKGVQLADDVLERAEEKARLDPATYSSAVERAQTHRNDAQASLDSYTNLF